MPESGISNVDPARSRETPDPSQGPGSHGRNRPRRAAYRLVPVLENVPIARDTYRLRLGDATMARAIKPGQFVMIRPGPEGATDPLLGRPLALYDVVRDPDGHAHRVRRRLPGRRARHGRPGPAPARRAACGVGPARQRLRPTPGWTGRLRGRRHRSDAVPGPGPLVARPRRLWCGAR